MALWLVITEGMRPALLGLALGLVATFPLARVLRSLLFLSSACRPSHVLRRSYSVRLHRAGRLRNPTS